MNGASTSAESTDSRPSASNNPSSAPASTTSAAAASAAVKIFPYHRYPRPYLQANAADEDELSRTTDPKRRKLLQNRTALRRLRARRAAEAERRKIQATELRQEHKRERRRGRRDQFGEGSGGSKKVTIKGEEKRGTDEEKGGECKRKKD